jgi:hypothetical protein
MNPDFAAALADPLVFRRLMLSAIEIGPERPVFRALAHRRRDEHGVMFALDFLEPITERIEKILIGGNDLPVHVEFDYSLGLADGGGLRKCVRRDGINAQLKHLMTFWERCSEEIEISIALRGTQRLFIGSVKYFTNPVSQFFANN